MHRFAQALRVVSASARFAADELAAPSRTYQISSRYINFQRSGMMARPNARPSQPASGQAGAPLGRRVPVKLACSQWKPYQATAEDDAAELRDMCDGALRSNVTRSPVSVQERLRVERALRVGPVLEDLPAA